MSFALQVAQRLDSLNHVLASQHDQRYSPQHPMSFSSTPPGGDSRQQRWAPLDSCSEKTHRTTWHSGVADTDPVAWMRYSEDQVPPVEQGSVYVHNRSLKHINVRSQCSGVLEFVIPCSCSCLDNKLDSPLVSGMVETAVKAKQSKLHRFFLSCKWQFKIKKKQRNTRKRKGKGKQTKCLHRLLSF